MSDSLNFDIEELVARYELHPDWRDVFVEGEQDRGLLQSLLQYQRRKDVSVFTVSVVNISPHLLLEKSLPHPSRRSEVIALAIELEARRVRPNQAACIADADFRYILPDDITCSILLWTDYASMELYAFSEDLVHAVLTVASTGTVSNGAEVLADLRGPLQFLFSIRAVNFDLKWGLRWIDNVDKFFAFRNEHIEFDENEFMARYLIQRVSSEMALRFQNRLDEVRPQLSSDVRCRIRGGDFVRVLTWYLRSIGKCKHLDERAVLQMLYIALPMNNLSAEPMFRLLLERLAS